MGQRGLRQQRLVQAVVGLVVFFLSGCCKPPAMQPIYVEQPCKLPPHPVLPKVEGNFKMVEGGILVTTEQLAAIAAQNDALKQWVTETWKRCGEPLDGGVTDGN